MSFRSILYRRFTDLPPETADAPEFFRDLNMDQIVASITAGRDRYDLKPFFHCPLDDADDIAYRQEVMRDLEGSGLSGRIAAFAEQIEETRRYLRGAAEAHYRPAKQGWFLEAVAVYCGAVGQLAIDLSDAAPQSRGLRELREYLARYVGSAGFRTLLADTERVMADLRAVSYCVNIRGLAVTVSKYAGEADYSVQIGGTFAKFRQGSVKDYRVKFSEFAGMDHIGAQILELVARLYPEIFSSFDAYCARHQNFVDGVLQRFDREVQFYISYLQYIDRLRRAGLPFCYPKIVLETKAIHGDDVFDLALAAKLVSDNTPVVLNDFYLEGAERVLVVSGPNQGGKTTFARTFGQLHYLARLGCPVPGSSAQLVLCDRLFTHFEREEHVSNLHGKLFDDLLRFRRILEEATPNSLVIMNEIFSSTALEDAVFLATTVMRRVLALDCLCVCVTFLDEVAALGEAVVSMVSTVVPDNPAERTLKLVRRPADGRAYAIAIAEKYRLTYGSVRERIAS